MFGTDNDREPFADALDAIFDRNEAAGRGPASLRALAFEIALLKNGGREPTDKQREQWRRALRRYMLGQRHPRPETVDLIATAALAAVEEFPTRQPQGHLRRANADLRRENRELRAQLDRLRRGRG